MNNLLPPNATRLERNAADVCAAIDNIPVPLRDLVDPATCPAQVLPWLAWHFSVDSWDASWTEAQQRAVIAASYQMHRTKGTRGAVERGLAALGVSAEIIEWWQDAPRAQAHTFRVEVETAGTGMRADFLASIERQIAATKPTRSHFTVQMVARPAAVLTIGLSVSDLVITTINPRA